MNSGEPLVKSQLHGYWPVIALGLVILSLGVAGTPVADLLALERAALEAGQLWRLVTAHLVHLNFVHTAMNLLAATLLILLYRSEVKPLEWLAVFLFTAIAVTVALYLWQPSLSRYVGASGVIHGLVTFAAIRGLSAMRFESVVLLIGVAAKLGSEYFRGPAASTEALIGGRVITEAHLYGALAGFAASIFWRWFLKRDASRATL